MSDIVERLRLQAEHGLLGVPDGHNVVSYGDAADEIERLREALDFFFAVDDEKPTSWKYRRENAEKLAREKLSLNVGNSSGTLTSSVVKDCLTTDCNVRRQIIDERDRTVALMLVRAEEIELLQAELNKAKTRGDILSDAIYYAIEVNDDCVNWLTDWFHGEPDAMRDLDRWREKTGRSKR